MLLPFDVSAADLKEAIENKTFRRVGGVRDLKVSRLRALYGEERAADFDALAAEILKEWPTHQPVLIEGMKRLGSQ